MNQVVVSAVIKRENTQRIQIQFGREGTGDDIVDQWADRLMGGMQITLDQTIRQAKKSAGDTPATTEEPATVIPALIAVLPEILRQVPPMEAASSYYGKIYHCANCLWWQMVWMLKGKRAPGSVKCERCECDTAQVTNE
jgi:hypothetical protein